MTNVVNIKPDFTEGDKSNALDMIRGQGGIKAGHIAYNLWREDDNHRATALLNQLIEDGCLEKKGENYVMSHLMNCPTCGGHLVKPTDWSE